MVDYLDFQQFKKKAFAWAANAFDICCCLDNNGYTEGLLAPEFDCIIACGVQDEIVLKDDAFAFEKLKQFQIEKQDWLFGFLSYDLKNSVEKLESDNFDGIQMPDLHFFQPQIVLKISKNKCEIVTASGAWQEGGNTNQVSKSNIIFEEIKNFDLNENDTQNIDFQLKTRFNKNQYLEKIEQIKRHILRGDIFEMNFCQEFYGENVLLNPIHLFFKLNEIAQAPFSTFYKFKDKYLLCASPERFMKKETQQLISQPIKGTSKRANTPKGINEEVDKLLKTALQNDPKNRSENVMIVDLVRNDLGKSCVAGSVKVTELFGIYSFPTVHQMISTIEGTLRSDVHFIDALKNAFPMGSMTGAPKVRAMQLIEQYELTQRGLYSGAVGYITPEGNFDFNVVIRSILYNSKNRYLSFQVGGAIVADSVAEDEYEECLVKAQGVLKALDKTIDIESSGLIRL